MHLTIEAAIYGELFTNALLTSRTPWHTGTSKRSQGEQLTDLDDIVNEPQPALGAPPGITTPALMGAHAGDGDKPDTERRVASHEGTDITISYRPPNNKTHKNRTISIDIILDEITQVLAPESNQIWTPTSVSAALCSCVPIPNADDLPSLNEGCH